jgi:hypothetical protein
MIRSAIGKNPSPLAAISYARRATLLNEKLPGENRLSSAASARSSKQIERKMALIVSRKAMASRSTCMKRMSFSGMNRRNALEWAHRLGCQIESIRGTGECRVFHPDLPRPIRINGRRKDAGRALTKALQRLVHQV